VLVEDVATGERQRVACDLPIKVGQEVVVQGRRWRVVKVLDPANGLTDR
jgi:hypothetical protein